MMNTRQESSRMEVLIDSGGTCETPRLSAILTGLGRLLIELDRERDRLEHSVDASGDAGAVWADDQTLYTEARLPGTLNASIDISAQDGRLFIRMPRRVRRPVTMQRRPSKADPGSRRPTDPRPTSRPGTPITRGSRRERNHRSSVENPGGQQGNPSCTAGSDIPNSFGETTGWSPHQGFPESSSVASDPVIAR
jgi:hypothetical protein